MQENADVRNEADLVSTKQPCLIVRAVDGRVKDCSLVVEKSVISKVPMSRALLFILFGSFYVYNVHYPSGCGNFYLIFESFLFGKKVPNRKPRLSALLAELRLAVTASNNE